MTKSNKEQDKGLTGPFRVYIPKETVISLNIISKGWISLNGFLVQKKIKK